MIQLGDGLYGEKTGDRSPPVDLGSDEGRRSERPSLIFGIRECHLH